MLMLLSVLPVRYKCQYILFYKNVHDDLISGQIDIHMTTQGPQQSLNSSIASSMKSAIKKFSLLNP